MESPERPGLTWHSSPRKLLRAILVLDDDKHSIALGTAIGMFIGMTPTVGIQMVIVLCLSMLIRRFIRFNVIAGMITVYISNPLTVVPIYYFDYWVGSLLMTGGAPASRFSEILENEEGLPWWTQIYTLLMEFGWPLVLGSLLVGAVCALLTYPLMIYLLNNFRKGKNQDESPPTDEQDVKASLSESPISTHSPE